MNKDLLENLNLLAQFYGKMGDIFRERAYKRAINSIKNYSAEIVNIEQTTGMKGIGKSIRSKIDEFLRTGKISKVQEIQSIMLKRQDKNKTIALFKTIWGVGNVKAHELWKQGFRTINQIIENPTKLNRVQKIGLKYYEDLLLSVSRSYIIKLENVIKCINPDYRVMAVGSYRRGASVSGDMDLLVMGSACYFLSSLYKHNIIVDTLSAGHTKFMGIAHYPGLHYIRLDIEFVEPDNWATSLLYFTGSKDFNVEIRERAKRMGYKLNRYGLFNSDGKIQTCREKDIFNILDIPYIRPEDR